MVLHLEKRVDNYLAVVKNGSTIEFASFEIQKDKDVLASVKNNIYALYTYRELQHDKDIFMAAPIGYSLKFASRIKRR